MDKRGDRLINFLNKNGKTYEEISASIDRTPKAVKIKLNKLGEPRSKYNISKEKKCILCGSTISKYGVLYCSRSCSSKSNNSKRAKQMYCLNCESDITSRGTKYCNQQCHKEHQEKTIIAKIESGDVTLNFRQYKKYLIKKYGEECMECSWAKANPTSGNIPIELEHIDEDSSNNSLDNLKILCPNCHSLTSTYKSLNKGNGRHYRRKRYKEGKSF